MIVKNKNRSDKHKRLFVVLFVLTVLFIMVSLFELSNITHFFHTPISVTTDQKKESDINTQNKKDFLQNKSTSDNKPAPNNPSDIVLSARQEINGYVTVNTQLNNYSDGICELNINNNGNSYSQTAQIIYQPTFSTCAGFSIPIDKLDKGNWQISLKITSKGLDNTKNTSLEVR